jgi:hypothetical protein
VTFLAEREKFVPSQVNQPARYVSMSARVQFPRGRSEARKRETKARGEGGGTVGVADVLIEIDLGVVVVAIDLSEPGPKNVAILQLNFVGGSVETHVCFVAFGKCSVSCGVGIVSSSRVVLLK